MCGRRVPKRGIVLVMGLLMELICYADRTNISLAIIPMAREHGYSESVKGVIMASFFAGYCGTQILGGAWAALRCAPSAAVLLAAVDCIMLVTVYVLV